MNGARFCLAGGSDSSEAPWENLVSKETRSHKTAWVKYTTNGDWIQDDTKCVYIYYIYQIHYQQCSMVLRGSYDDPQLLLSESLLRRKSRSEKWQSLQWRFICGLYLVGGWTNPIEKYARQNGNLPQIVVNINKYLKPPPRYARQNKKKHFEQHTGTSPFYICHHVAVDWCLLHS